MKCIAKTKSGEPCKNIALNNGYCRIHDPVEIDKKNQSRKLLSKNKNEFYEVLDVVEYTCKAKGWEYYLDSYDSKYYKYATVIVKKEVDSSAFRTEVVVGQFNTKINNGVKVSFTNTSFYGYGLKDLHDSIMEDLGRLPWLVSKKEKSNSNSDKEKIYNIISKFHIISTQLIRRYNNRSTIKIDDEYDVQDLFHALLKLHFDDIRPEEYSPSRGGGSSRLDFLLKREKIVIEIKMASKKLMDKKIGEQLIIDIERYKEHPDCNVLICFVYDPNSHIRNPSGLEKDLSRKEDNLEIKVFVIPR